MPEHSHSSKAFHVLVVDDVPENCYLLQSILEAYGHRVSVAAQGEEALDVARGDPPDILVTDILMPVMDGFRLCSEWKTDPILRDIPLVFYTATYTHEKDQRLALDLGADLFIRKPQEPEALMESIYGVLNYEPVDRTVIKDPRSALEQDYPKVLIRKLETKIVELEETRYHLSEELAERKKMEESLRSSEAKFRAIVQDQTEFIVRWKSDGTRTFVNRSYCDYFDTTPGKAVGTSFFKLIPPANLELVKQRMKVLTLANPLNRNTYRVERPDGSMGWIEWTDRAIFDETGENIEYQSVGRDITELKLAEQQLQRAYEEIRELKEKAEAENVYLKQEIRSTHSHWNIVGQSSAMKSVLKQVEQVAATSTTALILGETGTGKELVARAIHQMSPRKDKVLVAVNCAAMPETLVESELFGREKGAFTGANTRQAGRFEVANGSTLFLDEIGELPLPMQAKILRVLQEGQFERLGSTTTVKVDVRIIAATNRDLEKEVKEGRFREDLFYRINVFPIQVPPLRDRVEDIPSLVWTFVEELCGRMGKRIESIPKGDMQALLDYPWPGNIRELRNLVERAMIQSSGKTLGINLPNGSRMEPSAPASANLAEVERQHIVDVMEKCRWRIRGKKGAAEILGLKPTTLESRMTKLKIERPEH